MRKYYENRKNKLPIEFEHCKNKEFFFHQKGARVYYDITKQPLLKLIKGNNKYKVLSVGITKDGIPLITIEEKSNEIKCYRLPIEYLEWTITIIGLANLGNTPFPADVEFTKENGKYYVDIL